MDLYNTDLFDPNLDRTFCSGFRCGKAETCDRWTQNLLDYAARKNIDMDNRHISVAQFADHDGKCDHYTPMGEQNDKRKSKAKKKTIA